MSVSININYRIVSKDKKWEKIILNMPWDYYAAQKAYEYSSKILNKRWTEAEPIIIKNGYYAYLYARHVIKSRWPEVEGIIAKDAGYYYSKFVVKGRFDLFEKHIEKQEKKVVRSHGLSLRSIRDIYLYSKYVLKDRWIKAEKIIEKPFGGAITTSENSKTENWCYVDIQSVIDYIRFVRKSRWEKMENPIINSRFIPSYIKFLNDDEKAEFKNKLIISAMTTTESWKRPWGVNYAADYLKKEAK